MDVDSIRQNIACLGKMKFDAVVRLILERFFHKNVINVDRTGDGGSDFIEILDDGSVSKTAHQATIQESSWEEKAVNDAGKARGKLDAKGYYFFTNRPRQSVKLRELESQVSDTHKMHAVFLGCNEIADIIVNKELIIDYFIAIGAPLSECPKAKAPDRHMVYLHTIICTGIDHDNIRNSVIDDAILHSIHCSTKPLDFDSIKESCSGLIGEDMITSFQGRFDSLLQMGKVIKVDVMNLYRLSGDAMHEMTISTRLFESDMDSFSDKCSAAARDAGYPPVAAGDIRSAAMILARCSVKRKLEDSLPGHLFSSTGITRSLDGSMSELRSLLSKADESLAKFDKFILLISNTISTDPIIIKLSRSAFYYAVTMAPTSPRARMASVSSWANSVVYLDSSVAIPFLCSKVFGYTSSRFSKSASQCIDRLIELSANVLIPGYYLEEMASHLFYSYSYINAGKYSDQLAHSENGYVSYFHSCRKSDMPGSLSAFIDHLSGGVHGDWAAARDGITRNLQRLLGDYGVRFEYVSEPSADELKGIEVEYAYTIEKLKLPIKPPILVKHDLSVVAQMRRIYTRDGRVPILVTWDRSICHISKNCKDFGLAIPPNGLSEIVEGNKPLAEAVCGDFAFHLAAVGTKRNEILGEFMDLVIRACSEKLKDWQFNERLEAARIKFVDRLDKATSWNDYVSTEAKKFIAAEASST